MRRPPRLAERLLARRVRLDETDTVLGDLEEQFQERVRTAGAARATLWYWREAVRLVCGFWWWTPRVAKRRRAVLPMDDLRWAVRRLLRQPLTSAVSVLTLACAIGAAAATWSLVSATLLHPFDVEEPDRLVQIFTRRDLGQGPRIGTGQTYPSYRRLRDTGLMPMVAYGAIGASTPLLIEGAGEDRPRSVIFASHDFLDLLGLQPTLGRFFTPGEDQRGAPLVAVLSEHFWRRELNANPAAMGSVIHLRDQPVEIVGVAPAGFRGLDVGREPHLFMPLHSIERIHPSEGLYGDRPGLWWIRPIGRLPDGVTLEQMQDRLNALQLDPTGEGRLIAPYNAEDEPREIVLMDIVTAAIGVRSRDEVRQFSGLLGATVLLLLAIGSLTVGMLLVMRTQARGAELATCLALGASRRRLAAGVIVEGVLLAAAGALLALPVSRLLFVGLSAFELPGGVRVDRLDLATDGRLLAGIAATALVSVVVMGGLASLAGVRRRIGDLLREHSGATPRVARRHPRSALVTIQVAVTLVLVTGAGLFARSVTRALTLNPGIDAGRLVSVDLDVESFGYGASRAAAFVDELEARLEQHPAIGSLGLSYSPRGGPVVVDGTQLELSSVSAAGYTGISYNAIDLEYLDTIGLHVVEGRSFTADDRAGAPSVAIVTEALARHIAGDGSALGHRIVERGNPAAPAEIVGVVTAIRRVGSLEPLVMYRPLAQYQVQTPPPGTGLTAGRRMMVRAADDAADAIGAVISTVRSIDPAIRLDPMSTMGANVLDRIAPQRFGMTVMGTLGAIALFLSVLGTYVLAETMATLRLREIGIRAALGARGSQLRALLLQDMLRLVGTGLLLGYCLAWLGADTIRAFLFQVEPFDPLVTGGVAVTIMVLTLAVSLRPAFAAARLDVARVLRGD
jgi:predicted permease